MTTEREKSEHSPSVFRIGPLANLPLFFKLDGRRVVLVGGGEPALWKAELLAASGALVEVFSDAFDARFFLLAAELEKGQILLVDRGWTPDDLTHAALAVGSFSDEEEAAQFAASARAQGVPVNVVDRPALCDFQFGAIVNRSPLVVGISTDGAAPVFGQAVRSLIEGLLPETFKLWAAAARDLRRNGSVIGESLSQRRSFWQRFTDFALGHADRGPTGEDIDQLVAEVGPSTAIEPVMFVDVGDNVDTLTLAALRALRAADDIFIDESLSVGAANFARREAHRHAVANGRLNSEALIAAARNGRRVVRLRSLASSGGEAGERELAALRTAGIPVITLPTPFTS